MLHQIHNLLLVSAYLIHFTLFAISKCLLTSETAKCLRFITIFWNGFASITVQYLRLVAIMAILFYVKILRKLRVRISLLHEKSLGIIRLVFWLNILNGLFQLVFDLEVPTKSKSALVSSIRDCVTLIGLSISIFFLHFVKYIKYLKYGTKSFKFGLFCPTLCQFW